MTFDEQAVIDYVTKQRWYGAKSRSVAHSQVLDAVELRTTEPRFTLELVEMRYETGAHDIYQLVHGETEIDGLDLKVFRRLEPGINPELETLRFLTERGFANIAALGGWYAYSGGPLNATLGILQEFVRNGEDGWELAIAEIGSAPAQFLTRLRRLGEVT